MSRLRSEASPNGSIPPFARVLRSVGSPERDPNALTAAVRGCDDWPELLRSAARNNMAHQLAVVLKRQGHLPHLPPAAGEALHHLARQAVVWDRLRVDHLAEVIRASERAGLRFLLLKGLGFAERLYEDPIERTSVDIDILTSRASRLDAGRLLESLGFEPHNPKFYELEHFHVPYKKPVGPVVITVELHWQVAAEDAGVRFDTDSWLERARPYRLRSGPVLVPPPEEEFGYLCHHAFCEGYARLRDLSDIERFRRRYADELARSLAQVEAVRWGPAGFVREGVALSGRIWPSSGGLRPAVRPGGRTRRWLARDLLDPVAVVARGGPTWWPLRRICYWSMLDPRTTGIRHLVGPVVRKSWDERFAGARSASPLRRWLKVVPLAAALMLCALPLSAERISRR